MQSTTYYCHFFFKVFVFFVFVRFVIKLTIISLFVLFAKIFRVWKNFFVRATFFFVFFLFVKNFQQSRSSKILVKQSIEKLLQTKSFCQRFSQLSLWRHRFLFSSTKFYLKFSRLTFFVKQIINTLIIYQKKLAILSTLL